MRTRFLTTLVGLISMVIFLAGCSNYKTESSRMNSNVLIRFDKQDRERMERFVTQGKLNKFDYILAVSNTLEGGKIIYDLRSDQQDGRIYLTIDNTRDVYASPDIQRMQLVCDEIGWTEDPDSRRVQLSGCDGEQEEFSIFGFDE
ncbi:DUF4362 domain-containing protein [Cohnella sp. AR92]|uniref:DUF4362 domain-containing protein n=1 Tax=Cohnella sp. AR92 TaxID=648716 RepID=UPI000F8EBF19|nr:DUF4362 domain-containing protein [Cohnella sp. AR92]RUS47846.1 DUF4362 domain-containing protein [Cohnella sp. AR92]